MDDTLSDVDTSNTPTDTHTPPLGIDSIENVENQSSSLNSRQQQTTSCRINQSIVWEHFKKVKPIDKENPKARCNYCKRLIECHYKRNLLTRKNTLSRHCLYSLGRCLCISVSLTPLPLSLCLSYHFATSFSLSLILFEDFVILSFHFSSILFLGILF